jgi:hypothetical protein
MTAPNDRGQVLQYRIDHVLNVERTAYCSHVGNVPEAGPSRLLDMLVSASIVLPTNSLTQLTDPVAPNRKLFDMRQELQAAKTLWRQAKMPQTLPLPVQMYSSTLHALWRNDHASD